MSIEMLQKLKTLDLKHITVQKLPIGILKLKRMHYLMVYHFGEFPFTVPSAVK